MRKRTKETKPSHLFKTEITFCIDLKVPVSIHLQDFLIKLNIY